MSQTASLGHDKLTVRTLGWFLRFGGAEDQATVSFTAGSALGILQESATAYVGYLSRAVQ